VALWVRSYSTVDWLRMNQPATSVASLHRRLRFNDVYNLNPQPPPDSMTAAGRVIARRFKSDKISFWTADHNTLIPVGVGRSIPHWPLVLAATLLAALPWISASFSLRTLLIATTLIAILLGTAAYLHVW
jgi:hypothetical protein